MPVLKTYDLFVSHAWQHNVHYHKLLKMLQTANNFHFRNYSVPEHDPVVPPGTPVGNETLIDLINGQIKPVNCVLILGGMYAAHSAWIEYEINEAIRMKKTIIGVAPWGQEKIPVIVQNASVCPVVRWNSASVIQAVRDYC